eukprot:2462298-Alexandrium_andersonii.AAC.1
MSASLVGSEMCIRDSPSLLPGYSLSSQIGYSRSHSQFVMTAALRNGAPVSYTHLTLPTICSV